MLETRKITLAGSQPNDPILTNMFIFRENPFNKNGVFAHVHAIDRLSVNDCFLRNMQKYKYIANIDIDEVIIPQKMTHWLEMMEYVEKLSHKKVNIIQTKQLTNLLFFLDCRCLEFSRGFIFGCYAYRWK